MRQLAKKLESSKSITRHIKQVSSELQATQVNLLRHQRIEIPTNKSKWKEFKKSRSNNMGYSNEVNQQQALYKKKEFNNKKAFNPRKIQNFIIDVTNVVILNR